MKITIIGLVLWLGFVALDSDAFAQKVQSSEPIQVEFCDLIANPQQGKTVRTTAIYRYGFEWSELYCPGCQGLAWLEPSEDLKLNHSIKRKLKSSEVGRTVKVTVIGRMVTGGGYGHMGAYKLEFIVDRYEKVDVLLKNSRVYSTIPETVKPKIRCSQ